MLLTRSRSKPVRAHAPRRSPGLSPARVGRVVAATPDGAPLVRYRNGKPVAARVAAPFGGPIEAAVGRDAVLVFEDGDPARPIVIGWIDSEPRAPFRDLRVDGRRLRVEAEQELVLRCGDASITLTADGRVLIRGRGVLSHAKELNRIRGGQVKIN